MKKMHKKSGIPLAAAVLSAALMPMNLMTASAWEQVSGEEYLNWKQGSDVPKVLDTFAATLRAFGLENCDFDGNGTPAETEDFYALESQINALYQAEGYTPENAKAGYPELDINRDGYATPEDYCILLQYVQRYFDFTLNYTEMYATITRYHGTDAAHVSVPREVFTKGRIFPVMEIGYAAFQMHSELESITFRNYRQPVWGIKNESGDPSAYQLIPTEGRVTAGTFLKFGQYAFWGCGNLSEIVLPQHVCFSDRDPFCGADLLRDQIQEIDGIRYISIPENDAFIAFDLTPEKKQAVLASHRLTFSDKTTSICRSLTKQLDPTQIHDVEIPRMVNYIEDYAFRNFTGLKTVCGEPYADLDGGRKMLIRQYLSAFDNTQFIADATQARLDTFERLIRGKCSPETEPEKAIAFAGKLIAECADYSGFYSLDRPYPDEDPSETNIQTFSKDFRLYPNDAYYYNDLSRGTTYSASAVYILSEDHNTAYTDCAGFAGASSLLLDQLGIRNYFCGYPGHAFNIVYVDGKWHVFDMAGNSLKDPAELNENNLLGGLYKDMYLSSSRQFELFPHSAARQLTVNLQNTVNDPEGDRPAVLTVQTSETLTADEQNKLGSGGVFYTCRPLPEGWYEPYEGWKRYTDSNGRFLRSTYAPDGKSWLNEEGWMEDPEA